MQRLISPRGRIYFTSTSLIYSKSRLLLIKHSLSLPAQLSLLSYIQKYTTLTHQTQSPLTLSLSLSLLTSLPSYLSPSPSLPLSFPLSPFLSLSLLTSLPPSLYLSLLTLSLPLPPYLSPLTSLSSSSTYPTHLIYTLRHLLLTTHSHTFSGGRRMFRIILLLPNNCSKEKTKSITIIMYMTAQQLLYYSST